MSRFSLLFVGVLVAATTATAQPQVPAQVTAINEAIEQGWRDYQIRPAPDVDDTTWCRRVYLDVIGRIPSYEELKAFASDRSSDKRAKLATIEEPSSGRTVSWRRL